jgi:hypothetical protein
MKALMGRALFGVGLVTALVSAVVTLLPDDRGRVVSAGRPLPRGTRVTLGDVLPLQLPEGARPPGCIELNRAAKVIGATLARDVEAGAPITEDDLLPPDQLPAPSR